MGRWAGSLRTLLGASPAAWPWRETCAGWSGCVWRRTCSLLCPAPRPGSASSHTAVSGLAPGARWACPKSLNSAGGPVVCSARSRLFQRGRSHVPPAPRSTLQASSWSHSSLSPGGAPGRSPTPPPAPCASSGRLCRARDAGCGPGSLPCPRVGQRAWASRAVALPERRSGWREVTLWGQC